MEEAGLVAEKIEQMSFDFVTTREIPPEIRVKIRAQRADYRPRFAEVRLVGHRILSPADVYKVLAPLRDPRAEHAHLLGIDRNDRVVFARSITSGIIDQTLFFRAQSANLTVQQAKAAGSVRIVMAHNHPSGQVEPSNEDRLVTVAVRKLVEAEGLEFSGHAIIDHNTLAWIDPDAESWTEHAIPRDRGPEDWTAGPRAQRFRGPDDVGRFVTQTLEPGGSHVLWLDTQFRLVAVEPHNRATLANIRNWLHRQGQVLAAPNAIIVVGDPALGREVQALTSGQFGQVEFPVQVMDILAMEEGRIRGIGPPSGRLASEPLDPDARSSLSLLQTRDYRVSRDMPDPADQLRRTAFQPRIGERRTPGASDGWEVRSSKHQSTPAAYGQDEWVQRGIETGRHGDVDANEQRRLLRKEWVVSSLVAFSEGRLGPEDAEARQGALGGRRLAPPPPVLYNVTTDVRGVGKDGLRVGAEILDEAGQAWRLAAPENGGIVAFEDERAGGEAVDDLRALSGSFGAPSA
jgi:hypothetical protein